MALTTERREGRTTSHAAVRSSVPSADGARSGTLEEAQRPAPLPHGCVNCGSVIDRRATRCYLCAAEYRKTLPAPNPEGRPSETRVTFSVGLYWPTKKKRNPRGCACCRRQLFIGAHVHEDGSRG